MGYAEQFALGETPAFQNKIQVAALTTAWAVLGEAKGGQTPETYKKRQALAQRVRDNPEGYARIIARLLVTAASITASTTDAQLQTIVDNNWSKVAGVDAGD